ncbi:hypothetical protein LOK49_Contig511G00004 [Camellia lanceoleosa]|nr:hypothetical protein LOK49_Contig511G00004 [Camellia lanceoleosa]
MSFNQARAERSESHYRRPESTETQFTKGLKKSNGQWAQSRVTVTSANSESSAVHNGARAQPSLQDVSAKSTDMHNQRSHQTASSAPTSASGTSESTAPQPHKRYPSDTSKGVSLQFGSFSPNIVTGMQIPARTSSAPPNLHEQKAGATSAKNSSTPLSGASMAIPFHQSRVVQFGVPLHKSRLRNSNYFTTDVNAATDVCSKFPSPSFAATGHDASRSGVELSPQVGHQISSQMGDLVIGMGSHFAQQQPRKLGAPRISIKITDPKTHEELRLDKRADTDLDGGLSGQGSHPNMPLQPQPIVYGPSHQVNYFSHIHPNSVFFQNPASLSLTSTTQMAPNSQASVINYVGGQGSHVLAFKNPSLLNHSSAYKTGPPMHGMAVSSNLEPGRRAETLISAASSVSEQVAVIPAAGSLEDRVVPASVLVSSNADNTSEVMTLLRSHMATQSLHSQGDSKIHLEISVQQSKSISVPSSPGRTETVRRVDSIDDQLKPPQKKDQHHFQMQQQEQLKSIGEPDAWEDAADMSLAKLENSDKVEETNGGLTHHEDDGAACKKYSRDFLLTLKDRCVDLPAGFDIAYDMVEALMGSKLSISKSAERNPPPSSGRVIDRPIVVSRPDFRGAGMVNDDRWLKSPIPFPFNQDHHVDMGQVGNTVGFRLGQGGSHGIMRNLRGQAPGQYIVGLQSGPLLPLESHGGIQRNGPDADRWQRASGFQKGLIPSPQSPMQVIHKAANKYEVGKVTDAEAAKQRQLKAILNKLTPQNFDRLFEQVKEVNIDNAVTLTGVISQIFDKALMEPTFCEMYANFDNEKITFKRLLLNKCQEEFERGEREQAEADKVDGDGKVKQSAVEREEKRVQARRRMLGNIRLIGELYKKRMLAERIMHKEEDIEALCKLMRTIGEVIDHPKAKEHMDVVRFMLKDSIDLRKNKWQQRRKVDGPKKIEEVHRDAAQERQQVNRLARSSSISSSSRRGQPSDFGPRASIMFSPPTTPQGAFCGVPPQLRGFGTQGIRFEDRHPYENRTLSVPCHTGLVRDEKKLLYVLRDLNSPSFYPSMISIWVNDSLERKDRDRDLWPGFLLILQSLGMEC